MQLSREHFFEASRRRFKLGRRDRTIIYQRILQECLQGEAASTCFIELSGNISSGKKLLKYINSCLLYATVLTDHEMIDIEMRILMMESSAHYANAMLMTPDS